MDTCKKLMFKLASIDSCSSLVNQALADYLAKNRKGLSAGWIDTAETILIKNGIIQHEGNKIYFCREVNPHPL